MDPEQENNQKEQEISENTPILISNFTEKSVASKLICNVCKNIPQPNNVVLHSMCGKIFCKTCLYNLFKEDKFKLCPICKSPCELLIIAKDTDKFVYNFISELQLKCPQDANCKWNGVLGDLHTHLDVCDFVKRPCYDHIIGCKFIGNRSELLEHNKKNEGLHLEMYRKKYAVETEGNQDGMKNEKKKGEVRVING